METRINGSLNGVPLHLVLEHPEYIEGVYIAGILWPDIASLVYHSRQPGFDPKQKAINKAWLAEELNRSFLPKISKVKAKKIIDVLVP